MKLASRTAAIVRVLTVAMLVYGLVGAAAMTVIADEATPPPESTDTITETSTDTSTDTSTQSVEAAVDGETGTG